MASKCFVPLCGNRRRKETGISFHLKHRLLVMNLMHKYVKIVIRPPVSSACNFYDGNYIKFIERFPSNDEMRKKWLQCIGSSAAPTPQSRVCSAHFRSCDYVDLGRRKWLKAHAVPQLKVNNAPASVSSENNQLFPPQNPNTSESPQNCSTKSETTSEGSLTSEPADDEIDWLDDTSQDEPEVEEFVSVNKENKNAKRRTTRQPLRNFINMNDIIEMSLDKKTLIGTLGDWGVLAKTGFLKCPSCGGIMNLSVASSLKDGYRWHCHRMVSVNKKKAARCDKNMNVRVNTFFSNSSLTLRQIMIFCNSWVYNIDLEFMELQCRITKPVALDWNLYCTDVVIDFCLRQKNPIGGQNMTVELDEARFGKGAYHRDNLVENQWVLGGICQETGDVFLVPVNRRDESNLISLISKWVASGSTIINNCWEAYEELDESTFTYLEVNHSINFLCSETGALSKTVQGVWKYAKCRLPTYKLMKEFSVGDFAKFMFIHFCKAHKLDPTIQFFKAAGQLYNPYGKQISPVPEENFVAVNPVQGESSGVATDNLGSHEMEDPLAIEEPGPSKVREYYYSSSDEDYDPYM